jgi:hypothetical protein
VRNPSNVLALLLGSALLVVAPRTAKAQCPLFQRYGGPGALDSGNAIVAGWENPPHVDFFWKSESGWEPGPSAVIGDAAYKWPLAVSIDGERSVAGACEASAAYSIQGRAFVFEHARTGWVAQELAPSGLQDMNFFGYTVAVRRDVVAVGAMGWALLGNGPPCTHVFERIGAAWTETAVLPDCGEMAIDGGVLAIGGPSFPEYVDVYRTVAGAWTQTQRIRGSEGSLDAYFPTSIALRGGILAIGAVPRSYTATGFVTILRDEGGTFVPVQVLRPGDAYPRSSGFGSGVALSGSTLVVGDPRENEQPPGGAVHRYEYDGSRFVPDGVLATDELGSRFGSRVSVDGEDAIVGADQKCWFLRLGFEHAESFCPTTPNSTGTTGSLAAEGCDSYSGARLTLIASGLPRGVLAVCILGSNSTEVPFGDGFLCVGSPYRRLATGRSDASGGFVTEVPIDPTSTLPIVAGRSTKFQALHRDHGGARMNLTNAISIEITP